MQKMNIPWQNDIKVMIWQEKIVGTHRFYQTCLIIIVGENRWQNRPTFTKKNRPHRFSSHTKIGRLPLIFSIFGCLWKSVEKIGWWELDFTRGKYNDLFINSHPNQRPSLFCCHIVWEHPLSKCVYSNPPQLMTTFLTLICHILHSPSVAAYGGGGWIDM